MAPPEFDAVVVGAGAGGGVVAYVLASQGWRVAIVEKGRNPYPTLSDPVLRGSLFGNDEIRKRRHFGYHDPFIEPRVFGDGDARGYRSGAVQSLGVCVGGGTVFYDGNSPRLQSVDMRMRSAFGPVEGADVVDWPIGYPDLAPWYDAAERLIGIQGEAGADPFAEPRGSYPMPPGYPSKSGVILADAARALGYHPHPMPTAVNSIRYRGRPACVNCGFCAFGCPVSAKSSTAVTAIRDALRTGNCTLVDESCVTSIVTEPSGARATGVTLIDGTGAERTLTASHVVVAANAIETPRLLLASATAAHTEGLGNGSGLLGRYLMFHLVFLAAGVFDEEIRSYRGRVITHAFSDFTAIPESPGAIRGGYVELGGQIQAIEEGVSYPWLMHTDLMRSGRYRRRISNASMMGEDVPVLGNRVELDPEIRDVYGRPVARVTYARHPHDQAVIDTYMPLLAEVVRAAGAREVLLVDTAERSGVPDTKHLLGTARMGTDPSRSVTDSWGRLHECENVWIADGSLWPTSAGFNPTLTQQAMAWRTAAYMVDPANPRPVEP